MDTIHIGRNAGDGGYPDGVGRSPSGGRPGITPRLGEAGMSQRQADLEPRTPRRGALSDYAATLRRWRTTIAVVTLVTVGLAALYSFSRTPVYTSRAEVLVKPIQTSPEEVPRVSDLSAETEMNIAESAQVASEAATALGTSDVTALLSHVSASMTQGSQVLSISFTAGTPKQARAGAQAFAEAYLRYREGSAQKAITQQQLSLTQSIEDLNSQITRLRERIDHESDPITKSDLEDKLSVAIATRTGYQTKLGQILTLSTEPGQILNAADRPTAPSSPNHPFDLAVGLFFGLLLGTGIAFARDQVRGRLDSADLVEEALGVPTLALLPRMSWRTRRHTNGLVVMREPGDPSANAYRTLRTAVAAETSRSKIKTLLLTSASPGEGKTTTAANLAVALAELGKQVILVSADLRKPAVHRLFDMRPAPGLTELLTGGIKPSKVLRKTEVKNLRVAPSGAVATSTDAANLLESDKMAQFLAHCEQADWVIVDAHPVLGPADALVLVELADAVLFVVDARKTSEVSAVSACRHVERAGGRIIGVALNEAEGLGGYAEYGPRRGWLASLLARRGGEEPRRPAPSGRPREDGRTRRPPKQQKKPLPQQRRERDEPRPARPMAVPPIPAPPTTSAPEAGGSDGGKPQSSPVVEPRLRD